MDLWRNSICILTFVMLCSNILGKPLDEGEFDDSTVLVNPDAETTTMIEDVTTTTMPLNMTKPEKCAERYKVCRTFGPLPLPCCGDFVCKITYGEMHCVEHSFSVS